MEKIVIYGLGTEFAMNRDRILNDGLYEIIACTDSYKKPSNEWEKGHYIDLDLLPEIEFDRILICSSKYKDSIKMELVKRGVDSRKYIFLDDIDRKEVGLKEVIEDAQKYSALNRDMRFDIKEDALMLITDEKAAEAGKPAAHYFAQDIWGARKIFYKNPHVHYDIGSSVGGFIAHLLVFREVNYIDIRPMKKEIPGLHYIYGDAMNLEKIQSGSIESLSSFHALEHMGLGRYGDSIDPGGYIKAAKSMQRVLDKNGHLYLGVPVGPDDKLVFNAHRIFKIDTIVDLFNECKIEDMAIVEPDGVCAHSIQRGQYGNIKEFSCGLFEFTKI